MNITYTQNGDYLIPNIIIRKTKPLGHYGRLRKAYLEMHRPILFNELVLLFLLAYMGTTGNQPPLCTLLACLLILLYNGKRGKLKLKYFFYVFYPAHILVLYLIQIELGKYLLK